MLIAARWGWKARFPMWSLLTLLGKGLVRGASLLVDSPPRSLASVDGVRMEPHCSSWCLIGIGGYCLKMISTQSGIYKVQ